MKKQLASRQSWTTSRLPSCLTSSAYRPQAPGAFYTRGCSVLVQNKRHERHTHFPHIMIATGTCFLSHTTCINNCELCSGEWRSALWEHRRGSNRRRTQRGRRTQERGFSRPIRGGQTFDACHRPREGTDPQRGTQGDSSGERGVWISWLLDNRNEKRFGVFF